MKRIFTSLFAFMSVVGMLNAANVTFNVVVPTPTYQVWLVGSFNGWNNNQVQLTKTDDTHYTITVDDATWNAGVTTANVEYKYCSGGGDWAYVEKDKDGNELAGNRKYNALVNDTVAKWAMTFNPNVAPIPADILIEAYVPKEITELYATGSFNGWKSPGFVGKKDSTDTKMTYSATNSDANGNFFSIKIHTEDANKLAYKLATGPSWAYQQKEGDLKLSDPTLKQVFHDNLTFNRIYPGAAGLKTVTFNIVAPAGTDSVFMMGSDFGWDGKSWKPAVKNLDGTFTISYKSDLNEYKYFSGRDWQYEESKLDGSSLSSDRKADAQIAVVFADTIKAWKKTPPNSLVKLDMNKYSVSINNGSIKVEGVQREVALFDITGRKLQAVRTFGTFVSKKLYRGIYILRIDGASTKVSVK